MVFGYLVTKSKIIKTQILATLRWSWRFGQVHLSNKNQTITLSVRNECNDIRIHTISSFYHAPIESVRNEHGNLRFSKVIDSSYNARIKTTECYLSYTMIWVYSLNCVLLVQDTMGSDPIQLWKHKSHLIWALYAEINTYSTKSFLEQHHVQIYITTTSLSKCNT